MGRVGGDFWKSGPPAPPPPSYFPLTSRMCGVYFASLNNPTCYYCLPTPPAPAVPNAVDSLFWIEAVCMAASHIWSIQSVFSLGHSHGDGRKLWLRRRRFQVLRYVTPGRLPGTNPAFIAAGVIWPLWSLRYGAGRCGVRILAGARDFSFLQIVPIGQPPTTVLS
jgi:hypothetical protein